MELRQLKTFQTVARLASFIRAAEVLSEEGRKAALRVHHALPDGDVLCHGDFHPLNILVERGRITAVLDWPGFLITDPVLDIANTTLLTTIPFRHLGSSILGPQVASADFEKGVQMYLDAYRERLPLDLTHLEYYRARRGILALIEGVRGQTTWRHPPASALP